MIGHGFKVLADNGTIAVSDRTYNPVYIGDAAPSSYSVGARVALTDYYLKRVWTYFITSLTRPIPFVVPIAGEVLAVIQVNPEANNVWRIVVAQGQEYSAPRVLCFAPLTSSTVSGHGVAVWDSYGKLCFDSTKNHLFIDAIGVSPPLSQGCSSNRNGQMYYTSFPTGSSGGSLSASVASPAFFAGTLSCAGCTASNSGWSAYGMGLRAFVIQGSSVISVWGAAAGGLLASGPVGFYNNVSVPVAVIDSSKY